MGRRFRKATAKISNLGIVLGKGAWKKERRGSAKILHSSKRAKGENGFRDRANGKCKFIPDIREGDQMTLVTWSRKDEVVGQIVSTQ